MAQVGIRFQFAFFFFSLYLQLIEFLWVFLRFGFNFLFSFHWSSEQTVRDFFSSESMLSHRYCIYARSIILIFIFSYENFLELYIDISIQEDVPHSDKIAYVLLDSYGVLQSRARHCGLNIYTPNHSYRWGKNSRNSWLNYKKMDQVKTDYRFNTLTRYH